jgi:hypothetical protein
LRPGKRATGLDAEVISTMSSVKPTTMYMADLDVCPNESILFKPSVVKLNVTRSSGEK